MKARTLPQKTHLLRMAKEIAGQLRPCSIPGLRLSHTFKAIETNTKGWAVAIGRLNGLQTGLEIWVDGYARHEEPKFSACFWSAKAERIHELVKRAPDDWMIEQFSESDCEELPDGNYVLLRKLALTRFKLPIEEHYWEGSFFGFYDPGAATDAALCPGFIQSATAFFSEIARGSVEAGIPTEVYPRWEDRKQVSSHLRRERSRFLAERCKQRDGYRCKVCNETFVSLYGELGEGFAEAHHLTPLEHLEDKVKTRLEDLVTVCANCHRMLHRMDGEEGDLAKLRRIVLKMEKQRSNRRGS